MIEAEHSVIGGIFLKPDCVDDLISILNADDFINTLHQSVFKAFVDLSVNNEPIDIFTVSDWLEKNTNNPSQLGYLGTIQRNTPSAANVEAYAKAVKDASLNRQLATIAENTLNQCAERGDVWEKLDYAQTQVMKLTEEKTETKIVTIKEMLPKFVDDLDARFNAGDKISGMSTGYTDMDDRLDGIHEGDLIILAGRPSMGKTTLAMNIAEHQAETGSVLVFSMEMPKEQLVQRTVASQGRVQFNQIRSGKVMDDQWPKITAGVGRVNELKIHIDDSPGLTVNEVRSRARQIKKKYGLTMIVIDYLQLMTGTGGNRNDIISDISRNLKCLAKELQVPVIALSQLNRGVESRPNKRPVMSDLRESGAIEQDADVILFVYRDEVYNPNTNMKGIAEIIIGKQRNGPLGTVNLTFQGHYCRFDNFIGELPEEDFTPTKKWRSGFDAQVND